MCSEVPNVTSCRQEANCVNCAKAEWVEGAIHPIRTAQQKPQAMGACARTASIWRNWFIQSAALHNFHNQQPQNTWTRPQCTAVKQQDLTALSKAAVPKHAMITALFLHGCRFFSAHSEAAILDHAKPHTLLRDLVKTS